LKFLADENIPLASITALQAAGHEVFSVSTQTPGINDLTVWSLAATQQAILFTFDRDFGHLMIKNVEPKPAGVLYCRFVPSTPTETAEIILKVLESEVVVLEGYFTTLEKERARSRKL
jgi:predicted nuclease of predicted toxin-antitoxin system